VAKKLKPYAGPGGAIIGGLAGLAEGFRRQRINQYVDKGK
jgi:hypothetical protein